MKYLFRIVVCCVLFLAVLSTMLFAAAAKLELVPRDAEGAQRFVESVPITLLTKEPRKHAINYFDVRDDGWFLLCFNSFSGSWASVYSADGVFQYGFSVFLPGTLAAEWDGTDVRLLFIREDVAVSVNSRGEVLSVSDYLLRGENSSYWRDEVQKKSQKVNGCVYFRHNGLGFLDQIITGHLRLKCRDAGGNVTVLYSAGVWYVLKVLLFTLAGVLFLVFCFTMVIRRLKQIVTQRPNNHNFYAEHDRDDDR